MAKFRVYEKGLKLGRCLGSFEEYNDAKAFFEKAKYKTNSAVILQSIDQKWGWVDKDLETYKTSDWDERVDAYWRRMEAEEDDWHAGDAPWRAPGMSMRDFF